MNRNLLVQYARPQSSGGGWADRVIPQAYQVPSPLIYPESPWMPRQPDYETPAGRVYDPADITRSLLYPPTYQGEDGTMGIVHPPTGFSDTGFAGFLRDYYLPRQR